MIRAALAFVLFVAAPAARAWVACDQKDITPPVAIQREAPAYPPAVRAIGIEGTVEVALTILRDGSVGWVRVVRAEPTGYFEQAAAEGVRRWRFASATQNGKPIECRLRTRVRFALTDSAATEAGEPGSERPQPVYPPALLQSRVEGYAEIEYDLDPDGVVMNARVTAAMPRGEFEQAALAAVRSWRGPAAAEPTASRNATLRFQAAGHESRDRACDFACECAVSDGRLRTANDWPRRPRGGNQCVRQRTRGANPRRGARRTLRRDGTHDRARLAAFARLARRAADGGDRAPDSSFRSAACDLPQHAHPRPRAVAEAPCAARHPARRRECDPSRVVGSPVPGHCPAGTMTASPQPAAPWIHGVTDEARSDCGPCRVRGLSGCSRRRHVDVRQSAARRDPAEVRGFPGFRLARPRARGDRAPRDGLHRILHLGRRPDPHQPPLRRGLHCAELLRGQRPRRRRLPRRHSREGTEVPGRRRFRARRHRGRHRKSRSRAQGRRARRARRGAPRCPHEARAGMRGIVRQVQGGTAQVRARRAVPGRPALALQVPPLRGRSPRIRAGARHGRIRRRPRQLPVPALVPRHVDTARLRERQAGEDSEPLALRLGRRTAGRRRVRRRPPWQTRTAC